MKGKDSSSAGLLTIPFVLLLAAINLFNANNMMLMTSMRRHHYSDYSYKSKPLPSISNDNSYMRSWEKQPIAKSGSRKHHDHGGPVQGATGGSLTSAAAPIFRTGNIDPRPQGASGGSMAVAVHPIPGIGGRGQRGNVWVRLK